MTRYEIKQAYQKAKKAYEKRTGDKMVWVMNARQQELGTATICTGVAIDYKAKLRQAELRDLIPSGEYRFKVTAERRQEA